MSHLTQAFAGQVVAPSTAAAAIWAVHELTLGSKEWFFAETFAGGVIAGTTIHAVCWTRFLFTCLAAVWRFARALACLW
jgi:hypothetical protein